MSHTQYPHYESSHRKRHIPDAILTLLSARQKKKPLYIHWFFRLTKNGPIHNTFTAIHQTKPKRKTPYTIKSHSANRRVDRGRGRAEGVPEAISTPYQRETDPKRGNKGFRTHRHRVRPSVPSLRACLPAYDEPALTFPVDSIARCSTFLYTITIYLLFIIRSRKVMEMSTEATCSFSLCPWLYRVQWSILDAFETELNSPLIYVFVFLIFFCKFVLFAAHLPFRTTTNNL